MCGKFKYKREIRGDSTTADEASGSGEASERKE
jgi:hypothetical protein